MSGQPTETSSVVLRDGRTVQVRPMQASDEAELLQAFDRLDPQSRYMRFMRVVREPNLRRLRQVLSSFPAHGNAVVAVVPAPDGIDIVGSATLVLLDDPAVCEFAISVADAFAGAGLGRVLMDRLIDTARRRGLRRMDGFVLAANEPMLRLASRLGFTIDRDPEDPSTRICTLPL